MQRLTGDILLRLAGAALLALAYTGFGVLRGLTLRDPVHMDVEQWALGAFLFLSMTGGIALLILGRHLRDRIPLSARWARRRD